MTHLAASLTAAAGLALGLIGLACSKTPDTPASTPTLRVIAHVEIASAEALRDVPQLELVTAIGKELVSGEGGDESIRALEAVFAAAEWPVRAFAVTIGDERFVLGLETASRKAFVLEGLRRLSDRDIDTVDIAGTTARRLERVHEDGRRDRVHEGVFGGRHRLFIVINPAGEVAEEDLVAAATGELTFDRRTQRLRERAGTADVRFVFAVPPLLASLPSDLRRALQGTMGLFVGPTFTGVAGRAYRDDDHLVLDGIFDIRPGQGYLGAAVPRNPTLPQHLGWIPADAEFIWINLRGGRLGSLLQLFLFATLTPNVLDAAAPDAGGGVENPDWQRPLQDFVTDHIDGELGAIFDPSSAADATNPDAEEPGVFVIAVADADDAVEAVAELTTGFSSALDFPLRLRRAPELGERVAVLDLADEGEGPIAVARLVARQSLLFLAPEDEGSIALLKRVLATKGAHPIPEGWRTHFGDELPDRSVLLVHQSNASMVSGEVAWREFRRPVEDTVLTAIRRVLERHPELAARTNSGVVQVEGGVLRFRIVE